MQIIVSDSSCLIDLKKASLAEAFLKLPYEVLIPDTLFVEELLSFSAIEKRALQQAGLRVTEISPEGVVRAQQVIQQLPRLSIHDAFALVLAEAHPNCILLTGDGSLRAFARDRKQIEVRGVLWVIDQLYTGRLCGAKALHQVLMGFSDDPTVRLPRRELIDAINRFAVLHT